MDTHICHTDSEWLKSNMKKKKKKNSCISRFRFVHQSLYFLQTSLETI